MFALTTQSRLWLCTQPTDMRKSFNGLMAITRAFLEEDPASGKLFIFLNQRKTLMKVLYFEGDGYCIWSKRLEQGQFNFSAGNDMKRAFSTTEFQAMMAGIQYQEIRRYKRFSLKK